MIIMYTSTPTKWQKRIRRGERNESNFICRWFPSQQPPPLIYIHISQLLCTHVKRYVIIIAALFYKPSFYSLSFFSEAAAVDYYTNIGLLNNVHRTLASQHIQFSRLIIGLNQPEWWLHALPTHYWSLSPFSFLCVPRVSHSGFI